jgi:cleavage and polyadenylation specificity factor subunit 3
MMRLKSKLLSLNASKATKVKVYSPRNCEELRIPFIADKTAKVVGKLAAIQPPTTLAASDTQSPQIITGVLVQNDFKLSLMAPEDLREFAGLNTTTVMCKQRFRLRVATVGMVRWGLECQYGNIDELPEMHKSHKPDEEGGANGNGNGMEMDVAVDDEVKYLVAAYLVMGCVTVRYFSNREVELEWEGNSMNDAIADSVVAVLMGTECSPAAVKRKCRIPQPRLVS